MKALMILENGFEDTEALATFDVLKRAGIDVTTASINNTSIKTQSGHDIKSMCLLKDISSDISKISLGFDFLVIPGGRATFNVLDKEKIIDDVIDSFYFNNKYVCAICAAPMLIGKRGYFKDLKYTCFPGCESVIKEGKKTKDGVCVDGKFITATSMYYSIDFALEIIGVMLGKEKKATVLKSLMGK